MQSLHMFCRVSAESNHSAVLQKVGWLLCCFVFSGPLRQYSSLYFQDSRNKLYETKNIQTVPDLQLLQAEHLPYYLPGSKTPRH